MQRYWIAEHRHAWTDDDGRSRVMYELEVWDTDSGRLVWAETWHRSLSEGRKPAADFVKQQLAADAAAPATAVAGGAA